MRDILFACCILSVIGGTVPASAGISNNAINTASAENTEHEELRFTVSGTRLANILYWRIDSSGKGEISAPESVGYQPLTLLAASPVYKIEPGVHQFDIGVDGFQKLRAFLAPVIDVKRDPNSALTKGLKCFPPLDSGSTQITWTSKGGGSLMLPSSECVSAFGMTFKDRMQKSWHVLAEQMQAKGHPAVGIQEQLMLAAPKKLELTERAIWIPNVISWQINANGKGYIEFLQDGSLQGIDSFRPYYVRAGRYHFQLDRRFHQAVLRELLPYLNETAKPGLCEDEITISDQPMVKISWIDPKGNDKTYYSDLGCPSFSSRIGGVKLMFNELVGAGKVGDSVLLLSTKKGRRKTRT